MAEQVEEEENWWDQPVDVPPTPFTREPSERFADRDTRPTEAPDPRRTNEMFTPRQMLQEHQDQLHQALTANSNEMATAQGELSSMMSQLQQAMQEAGPQQQVTGRQPGQQPPQGMSGQQQSATQQMQEMLSSAAMQQAMAMATQAARQQQQQGQSQGQAEPADAMGQMMAAPSGGGTLMGQAPARPGQVIEVDFEALGITPESGAGLYRLPPRVRQPLMQGMNEKGPEAYQSMIDAYYRKLSENVEVDN